MSNSITRDGSGNGPMSKTPQTGTVRGALFRNSLAQMTNVIVNGLMGLVITRIITQQLGLASYGLFNTAFSTAILLGILADLGFSLLTVREMNRVPVEAAKTFVRITTLRLVVGVCVLLVALTVSSILRYPAVVREGVILLSLAVIISGLTLQFGAYFQARLEAVKLTWSLLAGNIVRFVFVIAVFIFGSADLKGVFFAYLFGALAGLVISVWLAREVVPAFKYLTLRLSELWSATVLGIVIVLGVIHFRLDVLLLYLLRSPEDVGAYGVAYRIFETAINLGMAFSAAFYPVMTRAFSDGDIPGARNLIQKSFNGLAGVSLGVVPLGIVGAPLAVLLLTGGAISESTNALRILILSLPVLFVAPIMNLTLVSLNRQNWIIIVSLGAIALNVLLNLLLIPQWGAAGAAMATLVSETFSLGAVFVLSFIILAWRVSLRQVLKYGAASAVTLAIALKASSFTVGHPIFMIGLLIAVPLLYLVWCVVFRAISWSTIFRHAAAFSAYNAITGREKLLK